MSARYRYGFNGKENDNEINNVDGSWQDYGMRMYDPRVGRFFSADPLMMYYPHYSPYQFAGNKPTRFIDLDGCEEANPQQIKSTTDENDGSAIDPSGGGAVPLGATDLMYYTGNIRTIDGTDVTVKSGSVGSYTHNGATYVAHFVNGVFKDYVLDPGSPPPTMEPVSVKPASASYVAEPVLRSDGLYSIPSESVTMTAEEQGSYLPSQIDLGCNWGDPTIGFNRQFQNGVRDYQQLLEITYQYCYWTTLISSSMVGGGEVALGEAVFGGTSTRVGLNSGTRIGFEVAKDVVEGTVGSAAPRTISSISGHAVQQAITRGFKTGDILKIVREGNPVLAQV